MYDLYKEFNGCFKINADTNGLKSIKSMTVRFWMAILIILIMDILYDSQLGSRPLNDGDATAAIKNAVYLQTIGPAPPPTPPPPPHTRPKIFSISCNLSKIWQNRKILCWYSPNGWRPLLLGNLDPPLSRLPSQRVEENKENLVERRNFLLISLLISKRQRDLS